MSGKKGAQGNHQSSHAVPDGQMGKALRGTSPKQRRGIKDIANAKRRRRDRKAGEL